MAKIKWDHKGKEYELTEVLIDGNGKIGKGVWHFSTLPGLEDYFSEKWDLAVKGTCPCNCEKCYGMRGNYCFKSTKDALAIRTFIAREDLEFLKAEIIREIRKHKIKAVRVHATGDFFSKEYVQMWIDIAIECSETVFWTYTKAEGKGFDSELEMFNSLPNCNIVPSVIKDFGFNFGHIDYLLRVFKSLKAEGKDPYICPCGTDKNQHCNNCKGCSANKYVLFVEHSTEYKAEKDALYPTLQEIIRNQKSMTI